LEDTEVYEDEAYRITTKKQFLEGYADSDSVYDILSDKDV
jgi:hypothetical protein